MSLRINTKPRRQNSRKADLLRRCPAHLQWLRSRPCMLASAGGCGGKLEAAHIDRAGGKGVGLKVSDFSAVPLCHDHHAEYHRGALTFEATHGVDLVEAASVYASRSPARIRHEQRTAQAVRA